MTPQPQAKSEDELREQVVAIVTSEYLKPGAAPAAERVNHIMQLIAQEADELHADTQRVTRLEVIDHRECVWCRGDKTATYLQKDGSYKEMPCDKCGGSGISGGRVYVASSNPERSIINFELSYQDDGKTLKVFVEDKEES